MIQSCVFRDRQGKWQSVVARESWEDSEVSLGGMWHLWAFKHLVWVKFFHLVPTWLDWLVWHQLSCQVNEQLDDVCPPKGWKVVPEKAFT